LHARGGRKNKREINIPPLIHIFSRKEEGKETPRGKRKKRKSASPLHFFLLLILYPKGEGED